MTASTDADFTAFVAASGARLFRTAYAACGDHQLAEDAVQAGLVRAYVSWRRVTRAGNPEAYVRRIVLNELFAWHRRARTRHEVSREQVPEPPPHPSHAEALEDSAEVWAALRGLPPRQRAVVVLRYVEDLSERETAELLGIRVGTVKSQAAAGLAHLRAGLGEPASVARGGHA